MKLRARSLRILAAAMVAEGIVVAQSPRHLEAWQLSAAPTLQIGEEGNPTREFSRIVGVSKLASGDIVVANAGTQELRVFSKGGEFLRSLSRRGNGPGELSSLSSISRAGDSVFAIERGIGPARIGVYSLRSGFLSYVGLGARGTRRAVSPTSRLSDGRVLVFEGGFREAAPPQARVWRDSLRIGILRPETPGDVAWIGRFPSASWFSFLPPSIPGRVWTSRFTLGAELITCGSGDRVWVGDSGTGEILLVGSDARVLRRLALPLDRRALNASGIVRERTNRLKASRTVDDTARVNALFSADIRPARAPLFQRFVPGVDGEIAVELFTEESSDPRRMVLLDRSGRVVAEFSTPSGFVAHEIGIDYVLGVNIDSDGVETVAGYRLHRR